MSLLKIFKDVLTNVHLLYFRNRSK